MTLGTEDRLVADYLADLARAAAGMPAARRAELLDQIAGHIDAGRAAGADDEAAVRTLLDRLGDPDEIVAAALDDEPSPAQPVLRRPTAVWEIVSVGLLTVGSFLLPIVSWLVGIVMVWSSKRWRLGEKLLLTLIVPGGPGIALFTLIFVPSQVCTTYNVDTVAGATVPPQTTCTGFAFPPGVGIPLFLLVLIGPFIVAGIVLHRAVGRAGAEPPVPAGTRWGGREIAAVLLLGPGAVLLPVVAPMVGLVVAATSSRWGARGKLAATALAITPIVLLALYYVYPAVSFGWWGWHFTLLLLGLIILGPILAATTLALTVKSGDRD